MRYLVLNLIILTSLFFVSCSREDSQFANESKLSERWDAANDPFHLNSSYIRFLAQLPTQGRLAKTPWSDSYWPSTQAGVSQRWNWQQVNQFQYGVYPAQQLQNMTIEQLKFLSPAEKFDILNMRYDYPLVFAERARTSPYAQGWEGLCHGWAAAALIFDEPKPVVMTNAHGIAIPFGSSDIKALLTYYQGQIGQSRQIVLGTRCDIDIRANPQAANSPACTDTNAGAFHIVLANQIGLMGEGFVADITRDAQVWNQPVHGFRSQIIRQQRPSRGAAFGTVKEVVVRTLMEFTVEVQPNWNPLLRTEGQANNTETYDYRLELDANDVIIGGEWLSGNRPDFLWKQAAPQIKPGWEKLELLHIKSIR